MKNYTKRILLTTTLLLSQIFIASAGTSINVKSIEEYNHNVTNGKPSIVYCYSPYCDACKTADKGFEAASQKYDQANFIKVNLDEDILKPIGAKNEIKAVPTTLLKNSSGKTESSMRGSREEKEYMQDIDQFLNGGSRPVPQAIPAQNSQIQRRYPNRNRNIRLPQQKIMIP